MRTCVIYATRYGNTEKIARSLAAGLRSAGVETLCTNQTDVPMESLPGYDLICIGAPTEAFTASKPIKEFMARMTPVMSGRYVFAFDTKIDSRLSGSASKFIESEMKNLGLRAIAPRESALVYTKRGIHDAWLKEGEEQRFERMGRELGTALSAKTTVVEPPA